MTDPIAVTRKAHRTLLKWHRARRRAADPAFSGRRIIEGMRLGASVEVDLVIHADRGFAVLHDLVLGRETTGTGRVVDTSAAVLRELHLRANDGTPLDDRVMLLDDLAGLMAGVDLHPDAILQLDFKEAAAALDARAIASFAASVAPMARHLILSSGDAAAVALLAAAAPGIHVGYDPCLHGAMDRVRASRDFSGFVAAALAAAPDAEMIYLHHLLVLEAADAGFDIVAAFHSAGRRIDAYTVRGADAETLPLLERLLALKVDQITTDDPEGVAAALW